MIAKMKQAKMIAKMKDLLFSLKTMLNKFVLRLIFAITLICNIYGQNTEACNLSSITLSGNPIDNQDGTFTFTVNVCVAIDVSWGGTTNFTIAVAGGSFTSIASIQTGTFTTSYNYCSVNCIGNICPGTILTGSCVSPIVNGGTFLNFTGCGNSPGNWITPDDYAATCVPNPTQICQDVTFTTNGYPSTITMDGVEDDVGPDVGSGGCLEVLTLPPQPGPPTTIDGCSGMFYDTGGPNGNYSNNENYEVTYCSGNGGPITITFNSFSVEGGTGCPYDYLLIYDGSSSGSPLLAGWCGTGNIPSYTSTDSCLTFVFVSDGIVTYPGWAAVISCPCTPPVASFTSNSPQCIGSSFSFTNTGTTGGGYTYDWTFSSGSPSTSTSENPTGIIWNTAGTYSVTLNICDVNDPTCCTSTTQSITVTSGPTVTATATDALCFGQCNGTVTATGAGGTLPYTYQWIGPNSFSASGQNQINLCAGTYTVQITDAVGCISIASVDVLEPNPIVLFAVPLDESCLGACDGQLFASVTGGVGPFIYKWDNGIGLGQSHSNICPGTYTVKVEDANGCLGSNQATITINPGLNVAAGFTYNGNQCLTGNSYCFINTGTSGATYSWDFGDGIGTSALENPCYTYAAAGTYTVTQTVTNGPCSGTASQTINVYSEPIPVIVGTDVLCNGSCDGMANLSVAGGTPQYTYAWSNSSTLQNISGLCAGTYEVTVTDGNGCLGVDSVQIQEPVAMTITISGTDPSCNGACDGTATVIAVDGTPPYTYLWSDPLFQSNATATGLCQGVFFVTVIDSNGCGSLLDSVTISDPPPIVLSTFSTDATCGLADGTVSVSASGGSSPYTYAWTGGCVTSSCSGLAAGSYTVTVTDGNNCTEISTVSISDGAGGLASIVVDSNVSCFGICDGVATASITGGTAPFTYLWDDPGAQTSTTITGLCAGTINVQITDGAGCISTASSTITTPPILIAAITGTNDATCNGLCDGDATVSASGGTGSYTYSWFPSGGVSATGTGLCAGTAYTVTVEDANGCIATAVVNINEPTPLVLTIISANPGCNGGSDGTADLTVTGGTSPYSYLWSNFLTIEDLSGIAAGTYTVTVTDLQGCSDISTITLNEPILLNVITNVIDASCGLPNGSACAIPSGGTPNYTYIWNDTLNQTSSCALFLPGGSYSVTVTDSNGCVANASVNINDIPGANATATLISNASGFSVCDGVASVAMPGTAPFTYIWNDPLSQTTSIADSLCAGTYCVTVTDNAGCTDSACIIITEPQAISITLTATNIQCNGDCDGTAGATVSGGLIPYTYQWTGPGAFTSNSQNLIGLCAGTYFITVTDANSIIISDSIEVTEPLALSVSVVGDTVTCNGGCDGSATAIVTGGLPPYTYLWDDGFSQTSATAIVLCAQGYTVLINDVNGCSITGTVTIFDPLAIIVNATSIPSACGQSNGSVATSVTNGTSPFTYLWSDGCTNTSCSGLPSGNYSVTVTDIDGCIGTGSTSIVDSGGPAAAMIDSTDISCNGGNDGTALVSVTDGTPPYTYSWNSTPVQTTTLATGLAAGMYVASIIDANGCGTAVPITLNEPSLIQVTVPTVVNPSCTGGFDGLVSSLVSGGTAPYTYSWSTGCVTSTCAGLLAGTYNLTVTDANNCLSTASAVLVDPPSLVMNVTETNILCNNACNGSAFIVPGGGTPPYTYTWSNGDTNQVANNLCDGLYTISLSDANGCLAVSSATITQPSALLVTIPVFSDIDCNGNCNGYAQSSVSGGTSPYTYLWSTTSTIDQISSLCVGSYTLTVTDNNGCVENTLVNISEPLPLTLSMVTTNVNCYNACDGMASVTAAGGVPPFTYLWNDSYFQTTQSATGLCNGTYSVLVEDARGCSNLTTVTITQPQVIGLIESTISSTCGNQNGKACVVVTGGVVPYTIAWNDPMQTVGTCIDSVFAGVYNPLLTDGNGCTFTIPVLINDIAGPTIDSVVTTDLACYGDANGTAIVNVTGVAPPYTYSWKDVNGDSIGTNSSFLFGLNGGTYTVSVMDNNSCLVSQAFIINEPLQLASAIISSSDITCNSGCDGTAEVAVGNGTPPYSYLWSPGGEVTALATGLCAGSNNVVIIDVNGCQINNGLVLIEPTDLVPSIAGNNISCYGGSDGEISVSVYGGSPPYTFTWLPSGIGQTISNLSAGAYTVLITDFNGCDANQAMSLIDPPLLDASGGSTPSSCGYANGVAYVDPSGGTYPYTYEWFDGAGMPIGQATDTVMGLVQGSYDCIVTDVNGCTFTLPIVVNDNVGPIVSFESAVDVLCFGTFSGEASVNVTGSFVPFTYQWNDPLQQTNKTATGLASGTYTVTVSDVNGCEDSTDAIITESLELDVNAFGTSTICISQGALISASAVGGSGDYIFSWDNGIPDTIMYNVYPIVTTTYTVIVTDTNNCTDTSEVVITVYPPLTALGVGASICEGDDGVISVVGSGGDGGPYNYTWLNTSMVGPDQTISGIMSDTTFTVVVSDGCSPNDTTSVDITVSPVPPPPLVMSDSVYCLGDQLADLTASGTNITWYSDTALTNILGSDSIFIPFSNVGTSLYFATQTIAGCESAANFVEILINPTPIAGFDPFPESVPITNPGIIFTDHATQDVIDWVWSFGDGDSAFGDTSDFFVGDTVLHLYADSGTFTIFQIVTNIYGCIDIYSDQVEITNEYILFAPLAFSPNGDGFNDHFYPKGIGINDEEFRFYIYDRWGDLIYEYSGPYTDWIGWDGRANDGPEIAQQDVYVWMIQNEDFDGDSHEYVGHVTLLK